MGFNISAASFEVSRQVRGIPDDVIKDNANNAMYGWMSTLNTAANKIATFNIANDGATCSKETTDISYINSNFPYNNDTEPDLFSVNAPGLSCQMIYDRATAKFHPLNYADLVINFTQNPSTGALPGEIISFTITNDKGIVYTFAVSDAGASVDTTTQITSGSPAYFTNTYNRYQHGITYFSAWKLTYITDPQGNSVEFDYRASTRRFSTDTVILYTTNPVSRRVQYKTFNRVTPCLLTAIGTNTGYLRFIWDTGSSGQPYIGNISGYGRNFQFSYAGEPYPPDNFVRSFLKNYTDSGAGSPVNYSFSYLGEMLTDTGYVTALPDSQTRHLDYWGYYAAAISDTTKMPSVYVNPSTAGYQRYLIKASSTPGTAYTYTLTNSPRAADPSKVAYGALNKIVYGAGGSSNIVYESNDYYDVSLGQTVQGGGIRVKQVIDSVSTTSTNNIIRNFSYANPSTGYSSGKPVTLPSFAFTIPYSGSAMGLTLWQDCTILSGNDLSDEDHTILYAYAKESQAGAGSTVYNYYVPATNWDASANPDCSGCTTPEWAPTFDYMARNDCSVTNYGPIKNDYYSYPFIPNTNYDFERGLPAQITSYKDDGVTVVSQANFTYQRLTSPSVITGFRWENNPNGSLLTKGYNKYNLFYNVAELNATVNKSTYGTTGSAGQSGTVTYTFGSANHKLLTQEATTNSDGTTLTTNITYVKDCSATTGSNVNATALYYLKQENINAPVESYRQYTSGGTTVTTGSVTVLLMACNQLTINSIF